MDNNEFGKKLLIIILTTAFILRLIMFFPVLFNQEVAYTLGATKTGDALGYRDLGIKLSENNFFDSQLRAPGYPFFLSLFYRITNNFDSRYPVIFQIFFSIIIIFAIIDLGKLLFNKTIGLISGLVYALAPLPALFANRLMTESLASGFYFLTIYLIYKALLFKKWRAWILLFCAGICLSMAIIIAPSGIYLLYILPLSLFFIIFFLKKKQNY